MRKKLVRLVTAAGLVAALTFTPTAAIAGMTQGTGLKCLIMIDTPWGDFCLIPDVLS